MDSQFLSLCEEIEANGYQAGIAYIGFVGPGTTENEIRSYLENSQYAEKYAFLYDAPIVDAGGVDLYAVVTTGKDQCVSVYPAAVNEDRTYEVHTDQVLYEGKGRDYFLVQCNTGGEIYTSVSILFQTGDAHFSVDPLLTGVDGRLTDLGCYDFSIYEDGQFDQKLWNTCSADKAEYIPDKLDGNYTYVDNEKLLEIITGTWISEDSRFKLFMQDDSSIIITRREKVVLEDILQFSYLQPGYVACTEFELNEWKLTDPDGGTLGTICSLYYEAAGKGLISMEIEAAEGNCETIVFKKAEP